MRRNGILFNFALCCVILAYAQITLADEPGDSSPLQLISAQGSERATSGAGVKVVTFGNKTHVVWQDANEKGEYLNQIRTLNHETNQWSETFTLNKGKDNHARPVIAVDAEGYLHVILSGHNTPVTYRRSVQPNDATKFTKSEPTGDGTYPFLTVAGDGTLLMGMRSTNRWNGVDLYSKKPGEAWRLVSKLVNRDPKLTGYAGFQIGMAWGPKKQTLHVVIDFYESKEVYKHRGVHQAVCYMQSPDAGETWQKADGTPIALPARPEQMDILARREGPQTSHMPPAIVLAQGSIAIDRAGKPYVLYISHVEKPGQTILASADDKGVWTRQPIDALAEAFPDHRAVGCRGTFSMDSQDNLSALLALKSLDKGWANGMPIRDLDPANHEGRRLVWVTSTDAGKTFKVTPALPEGQGFYQQNVERSAGCNQLPAGQHPAYVFFVGNPQYRDKGEVILNHVYFVPAAKD